MRAPAFLICLIGYNVGCSGIIGDKQGGTDQPEVDDQAQAINSPSGLGHSGLRRLSRAEYANSVQLITGVQLEPGDLDLLPNDSTELFDNEYSNQSISAALLEGTKLVAQSVIQRVLADAALKQRLVPCIPEGPSDQACFERFVRHTGRLAFRRPLTDVQIKAYTALFSMAEDDGDFFSAVGLALEAFLRDAQFLYRIEVGDAVAGQPHLRRLNRFELITRLAFTLWGSGPDDTLLDIAASNRPLDVVNRQEIAAEMLQDPKAAAQLMRFHAMWLNYQDIPVGADLKAAMKLESDALVHQLLVLEKRPWIDLFTATQSYVTEALAAHYGLKNDQPGVWPRWLPYGSTGRAGILSHGAVLSNGYKFGDTSIVQRGLYVQERLLCHPIELPVDMNVDVDEPPLADEGECKPQIAERHASGGCANCHSQIDPIGLGLEHYDALGRYRTHEPGASNERGEPSCLITGQGALPGVGSFTGPGELGQLLSQMDAFKTCMVQQIYRFVLGRPVRTEDRSILIELGQIYRKNQYQLQEVLIRLVSSQSFLHRAVGGEETM